MSSQGQPAPKKQIVYREFGQSESNEALERALPALPPQKQNLKVRSTRSGRKGKTVTVIEGFQQQPESLHKLLKQLKVQCGSGGTVKENELEIQGEHCQKIARILLELGYKVKVIA